MPQRVINTWMIVVGIVGLVLLGVLVLLRTDLGRASRTGPRWRRYLLTAALALLSGLGVYVGAKTVADASEGSAAAGAEGVGASLAKSPQWQRLTATWKEAEEVGSGKRGPYPFDRKGKESLLLALAARGKDVDALAAAKLLTAPETELLKKELTRLIRGVHFERPVELRMATCYKPMWPLTAPVHGIRRLAERVAALERLAESQTLNPQVVRKVLAPVEADIKIVEGSDYLKRSAKRKEYEQTLRAAKAAVARIRARLSSARTGLEATAQWKTIIGAWRFAKPLADSHKSTTAQRMEAHGKLKAARLAVTALVGEAAISPAEGALLIAEADSIRREIYRTPPIEARGTCYDMVELHPTTISSNRLRKRLPLLQKLTAHGKVTPAVLARVLPTVRADLATLADPKQTGKLAAAQRRQFEGLIAEIKAVVAKLEKR